MEVGNSLRVPDCKCTNCGASLNGAFAVGEAGDVRPRPGDSTICIECGHLMIIADDLSLRDPNDAEIIELAGDERVLAQQAALALAKKVRKGHGR